MFSKFFRVSHHLEEIEATYWEKQFGMAKPESDQILDSLVLKSEFEEDDEIDTFDFTLPGEVTDYVICVTFDDEGEIVDISMES